MADKPVAAGKSSFDHIDAERAFALLCPDAARVYLDLACGAGRYTLALAERLGPDVTIHALDLWAEGVEALAQAAKEKGFDGIRAERADITRPLPLPDGCVDAALVATALHDLPASSLPDVADEISRVLAPGGTFSVIEFKKIDKGPGPPKPKRLDEADLKSLLEPLGFTHQTTAELGEFTYLARFSAPESR